MKITDQNSHIYIGKYPMVVKFWEQNNNACRRIKSMYSKLMRQLTNEVLYAECNIADSAFAKAKGVRNTPTVLFFNEEGRVIDKIEGEFTEQEITSKVRKLYSLKDYAG